MGEQNLSAEERGEQENQQIIRAWLMRRETPLSVDDLGWGVADKVKDSSTAQVGVAFCEDLIFMSVVKKGTDGKWHIPGDFKSSHLFLTFTPQEWQAFLLGAKDGEFDLEGGYDDASHSIIIPGTDGNTLAVDSETRSIIPGPNSGLAV